MASTAVGDASTAAAPSTKMEQRALGERPLLTTPRHLHEPEFLAAEAERLRRQPWLGASGLVFVVPLTVLFALGLHGAQRSLVVFAPIVLFAMPVVVMITFWWEDWPGTSLRPRWTLLVDSGLIAAAAVVQTGLAQAVVAHLDIRGVFAPSAGHVATFPATLPIGGAAFVAMIELTLVSEGWPLRRLGKIVGGLAALVCSWGLAIVVYYAARGWIAGGRLGALLVVVGLWQVWFFLVWRGWPFSTLSHRWQRLVFGNATIVGGGIATYAVLRGLLLKPTSLNAAASSLIAAALLLAVLFEGWPQTRSKTRERLLIVAAMVPLAGLIYIGMSAFADRQRWNAAQPAQWVSHITLVFVAAVLLHVAVGRRWPFVQRSQQETL